ncbi:hypothetical protein L2E82_12887 [Cichorium intybus]|uniref:Uncharacterized protein n=1 Tax=Cichorium intybus TaxID=13427 RepID=A0ACB9GIB5_CICIN|nr:hypothetical protein L2E82_12887 [Cichorium intybus]
MVKDEGWIDEVGEEEVNSEDDSSMDTSEDDDNWRDDYSSNNSVGSQSEAGFWSDGEPQIDVEKVHQQSGNDGLGRANSKGNQELEAEKDNDCETEGANSQQKGTNGYEGNMRSRHALSPGVWGRQDVRGS